MRHKKLTRAQKKDQGLKKPSGLSDYAMRHTPEKNICPKCRGTGKVDGKKCRRCKGTGRKPIKDEA